MISERAWSQARPYQRSTWMPPFVSEMASRALETTAIHTHSDGLKMHPSRASVPGPRSRYDGFWHGGEKGALAFVRVPQSGRCEEPLLLLISGSFRSGCGCSLSSMMGALCRFSKPNLRTLEGLRGRAWPGLPAGRRLGHLPLPQLDSRLSGACRAQSRRRGAAPPLTQAVPRLGPSLADIRPQGAANFFSLSSRQTDKNATRTVACSRLTGRTRGCSDGQASWSPSQRPAAFGAGAGVAGLSARIFRRSDITVR